MRVLIVYAGRTGTTERAAKRLAGEIPHSTLRNLNETGASPERDYDVVVIGSSVRNLEIEPAVRKWLIAHEDAKIAGAFNGLKGENITL